MDGYGKIFKQIYDGTLVEHWQALITFQQMIVLCSPQGVVDMTAEALSRRTGIPLPILRAGIIVLEAPDPRSRSAKASGARIERLDPHREWGWRLVNHRQYQLKGSAAAQAEYDREYSRSRRTKLIDKAQQSEVVGDRRRSSGKSATQTQTKDKEYTHHGEFVLLTTTQHQTLIGTYGETATTEFIERLNAYIGSKGTRYKSHYHTLIAWMLKDRVPKRDTPAPMRPRVVV